MRHNMPKLMECQRGIVTKHFRLLSCLSRVAGSNFKRKSRFKSSKSSHRCSNANAKFQFLFWNATESFSFETYRKLILYFTINTKLSKLQKYVFHYDKAWERKPVSVSFLKKVRASKQKLEIDDQQVVDAKQVGINYFINKCISKPVSVGSV